MADPVVVKVVADGGEAAVELARITSAISDGFKNLGESGAAASVETVALGNVLADLASKGAAMAADAFRSIGASMKDWIDKSNDSEDAQKRLDIALQTTGQAGRGLEERYREIAEAAAGLAKIDDDDLYPSMSKLITIGGLHEEQMERATKAAMDLSVGLGIGLEGAFNMVAKGVTGHVAMFQRYGIELTATGDKTKDFEMLMRALEQRFSGSAAMGAETFSARMRGLSVSVEDAQEALGGILKSGLSPLLAILEDAVPMLQRFVEAHKTEMLLRFTDALAFVADGAMLVVNAGLAIVETYAEVRGMFARLLEGLKPVFEAFARINELTNKESGRMWRDLAAGVEMNTEDQARFAANVGATTAKIESQAQALHDGLIKKLGEAAVATDNHGAKIVGNMTKISDSEKLVNDYLAKFLKGVEESSPEKLQAQAAALTKAMEETSKKMGDSEAAARLFKGQIDALSAKAKELHVTLPESFNIAKAAADAIGWMEKLREADAKFYADRQATTRTALAAIVAMEAEKDKHVLDGWRKTVDAMNAITTSRSLTDEDDQIVKVDKGDDKVKGTLDALKRLEKEGYDITANFAKAARESIVSGNLGALGKLIEALVGQSADISKLGGLSNVKVAQSLQGLAQTLQNVLTTMKGFERRESGGPVFTGRPYLVGERGPEVIVPTSDGHVIPNGGKAGFSSGPSAAEIGAAVFGGVQAAMKGIKLEATVEGRTIAYISNKYSANNEATRR